MLYWCLRPKLLETLAFPEIESKKQENPTSAILLGEAHDVQPLLVGPFRGLWVIGIDTCFLNWFFPITHPVHLYPSINLLHAVHPMQPFSSALTLDLKDVDDEVPGRLETHSSLFSLPAL